MAAKAICCIPLDGGIGATFIEDEHGWRFGTWHSDDDVPVPHRPTKTDSDRYFDSVEAAARFFHEQYADWLLRRR